MRGRSARDRYFCGEATVVEFPLLFLGFRPYQRKRVTQQNQLAVITIRNVFSDSTESIPSQVSVWWCGVCLYSRANESH